MTAPAPSPDRATPPPATRPLDLPMPADDDRSARAASLRSRAAVEAGDREAWLALFAPDGVVQDPVGVSMFDAVGDGHRGPEARAAFWDTVIAPNPVTMAVWSSHAGGNEVANVVTITTTFPDGGRALVDVVAVYEVDEDGRILSLRAFWELGQLRFEPALG
ncbi:MAG: hypothetical protein JWM47_670 [Acidimicrobiales bacterium]|nr:hypothetical protein [Acidimicrobiales bacterium]